MLLMSITVNVGQILLPLSSTCSELRGTQSTDETALDWTTQHPVSDTTYPVSERTYPESDIESPVWQKTTGRDRHVTKV